MSDGIRSGVNWMRRASSPSTVPIVSTSLVLARPGKTDQQRMAAREHGDQRLLDHAFLAEDDLADRGLGGGDLRARRFGRAHDHVFQLFQPVSGCRHVICSLSSGHLHRTSVAYRASPA